MISPEWRQGICLIDITLSRKASLYRLTRGPRIIASFDREGARHLTLTTRATWETAGQGIATHVWVDGSDKLQVAINLLIYQARV